MSVKINNLTPYPEVNTILQVLHESVKSILGSHFIGMYLDGSLTSNDFDEDSDIDFVVVTDEDISGDLFSELQGMHDRIAMIDSPFAVQLEGSYISRQGLRRFDPEHALHPNIERGNGERLKMVYHDDWWIIHRYILRERGLTISGPAPQTLIDPVSPDDLRRVMLSLLHGWATQILNDPNKISSRGYQSYVVLSLCRILYTLQFGDVVSKPIAAGWAKETLGDPWISLIDRAWEGRHHPEASAEPEDINGTLDFIRFALEYIHRFTVS
jgi:aminoglycoside adenylyltransferase-like protein/nucleotidyltransferase-like protein